MKLELLAPAKNLEQGLLALRCGADALYVGGPRFGARRGAANELPDLERLIKDAHFWRSKVYITLNTILFEDELDEARRIAWALHEIGADALIIQDMAFLQMDMPDIPLHASTQAVCDSADKVAFLASAGFSRAILARELSLDEIKAVREATDIELEVFVYGALCVSESGRCYLSQAICGRSGNRGECAQPCRRDWSLLDGKGRTLIEDRPLLSIKDLDLSGDFEALVDVGIFCFKIEGRLKDGDYVKNVVSHLRRKLDMLLDKRPEFSSASSGRVKHGFEPDPAKTFHRGQTSYQMDGGRRPLVSGLASGHLGELVGVVESIEGAMIILDRSHSLKPGDGLALPGPSGRICGTLVNASKGRQASLQNPAGIRPGQQIFRNFDHAWHKTMRAAPVNRSIAINASLDFPGGKAWLKLCDEDGVCAEIKSDAPCNAPKNADIFHQVAKDALSRLGGTPFILSECCIGKDGFLPLSRLNAMRREAIEQLMQNRASSYSHQRRREPQARPKLLQAQNLGYEWNVSNSHAKVFYERHGARSIEQAYELSPGAEGRLLMATRLCLKYELGWCPKHQNDSPLLMIPEPKKGLYLKNGQFLLECIFDCERCRMMLRHWQSHDLPMP
jgi:putative protease